MVLCLALESGSFVVVSVGQCLVRGGPPSVPDAAGRHWRQCRRAHSLIRANNIAASTRYDRPLFVRWGWAIPIHGLVLVNGVFTATCPPNGFAVLGA